MFMLLLQPQGLETHICALRRVPGYNKSNLQKTELLVTSARVTIPRETRRVLKLYWDYLCVLAKNHRRHSRY